MRARCSARGGPYGSPRCVAPAAASWSSWGSDCSWLWSQRAQAGPSWCSRDVRPPIQGRGAEPRDPTEQTTLFLRTASMSLWRPGPVFLAPFRLAPLVEGASRRRAAPAAASDRAFSSTDRADVRLAYDAHTAPACRGLCVGVLRLLAVLAAAGDCTPSARSVLHSSSSSSVHHDDDT